MIRWCRSSDLSLIAKEFKAIVWESGVICLHCLHSTESGSVVLFFSWLKITLFQVGVTIKNYISVFFTLNKKSIFYFISQSFLNRYFLKILSRSCHQTSSLNFSNNFSLPDCRSWVRPLFGSFSLGRSFSSDGPLLQGLGAEPAAEQRRHRSHPVTLR